MEYQAKRVLLQFFLFFIWVFLMFCVKALSIKRSSYIIQMDKSQMPIVFTTHHNWYLSIINSFKFSNPTLLDSHQAHPYISYTYGNAFYGFCAVLTPNEVEALQKSPGFISAHIDTSVTFQTTHTYNFLSLNVANGPWKVSNYGNNIIIAILDSGVWPESPSFNSNGMLIEVPMKWKGSCEGGEDFNSSMCNSKIIGARYFNKGMKKAMDKGLIHSKDSARDDVGHGTQVASIAAGNYVHEVSYFGYAKGTTIGVAPHARLAIYKVIWNEGSYESDVCAGIEQAIIDGVDVINFSVDSITVPLYNDVVAKATFTAMEKGIVFVVAAGNRGPALGTISNSYPWVLSVAASTIDRWFAGSLTLGNGVTIVGWSMFLGDVLLQNLPLVHASNLSLCSSQNLEDVPHGIIMCNPGNVEYQIDSIVESSAIGAILIYDHPRLIEFDEFACPCIVISLEQARIVMSYIENNISPTVTMNFKQSFTNIKPAPTVASYTSRGPSTNFQRILKPDIMAPGSLVLAAWVPTLPVTKTRLGKSLYSSYIINSGTSLATPHVAGVVALLKVAHPRWSIAAIKSAIITTANTLDNTLNPIQGYGYYGDLASPFAMGAGQINPTQALDPGLVYDATPQDFVDMLCSIFSEKQVFAITKHNCIKPSFDLNYPSFISFYDDQKTLIVDEFHRTVTNVGEGVVTYKATVVSPHNTIVKVSPMILMFQSKYERQSYNITITYRGDKNKVVSNGELLWVDSTRKYRVRSPIVVSPRVIL